jgi:hypothetical protein
MTSTAYPDRPAPPVTVSQGPTLRLLRWLAFVLVMFVVVGKSFAYLGVAPVYLTEVTAIYGLVVVLIYRRPTDFFGCGLALPLLAFVAVGLAELLLGGRPIDVPALRDSVIWGYALFAGLTFLLFDQRPRLFEWTFARYATFCRYVIPLAALSMMLLRVLPTLPPAPWIASGDEPIIWPKGGDIAVQVGAAIVAYSLGLVRLSALNAALLALSAVSIVSVGRSPLLSVAVQIVVCVLLTRRRARVAQSVALLALGVALILPWLSGIAVRVSGERDFSADQILWNVLSLFDTSRFNDTMEFRWLWWSAIVEHVLSSADFWFGMGFGDTLAVFSAVQVDPSLRSPHNIFITILGRMGVIGLVAWCVLLAGWAWRMLRAAKLASRAGDQETAHRCVWLLGYGVAMVVNASTDVALEGPMAGVWFWCLLGFSLAYARQRRSAG